MTICGSSGWLPTVPGMPKYYKARAAAIREPARIPNTSGLLQPPDSQRERDKVTAPHIRIPRGPPKQVTGRVQVSVTMEEYEEVRRHGDAVCQEARNRIAIARTTDRTRQEDTGAARRFCGCLRVRHCHPDDTHKSVPRKSQGPCALPPSSGIGKRCTRVFRTWPDRGCHSRALLRVPRRFVRTPPGRG